MTRENLQVGYEVNGKVVIIYAVVGNTDTMEGKGEKIDLSYHPSLREAKIGASRKGVGIEPGDAPTEERLALRLSDGRYLLISPPIELAENTVTAAKVRAQALAKLTPAEKAALFGEKE
jgi:hypothetical protein